MGGFKDQLASATAVRGKQGLRREAANYEGLEVYQKTR